MFNTVKRTATVVILILLLLLFTVPSMHLSRYTKDALAHIDAAKQASDAGDLTAVREHVAILQQQTDIEEPILKLFLHHDAVDDLAMAVALVDPEAETDMLTERLAAARGAVEHVESIEVFDWATLL